MDMGGTSTDISLIRGGRPQVTKMASLERVPIRVPVIDINAIGAGGGSIAWIGDGGALRVGPIERGYDPRDLTLVPFGGPGPMHGTPVARELSIPRILVPPNPGILCALGMLVSDLRHDFSQTWLRRHAALGADAVEAIIGPMRQEAGGGAVARRGAGRSSQHASAGRYAVCWAVARTCDPAGWDGCGVLGGACGGLPCRASAAVRPRRPGGAAGGRVVRGDGDGADRPADAAAARCRDRDAAAGRAAGRAGGVLRGKFGRWLHDTAIWPREHLLANNVIEGTAVVEELSATTVLYPGDRARVGAVGSLIVEVGS